MTKRRGCSTALRMPMRRLSGEGVTVDHFHLHLPGRRANALAFRVGALMVQFPAWQRSTSRSSIYRYATTRRSRPISDGASSTRAKPASFEMFSSSAKV
jgi:hypothetical protein